jgi:hypothetical protein
VEKPADGISEQLVVKSSILVKQPLLIDIIYVSVFASAADLRDVNVSLTLSLIKCHFSVFVGGRNETKIITCSFPDTF